MNFRAFSVLILLWLCSACGGSGQAAPVVPKVPEGPATTPVASGRKDGLEPPPKNRPRMSAAASQAYLAGLTAFRNGDLPGASTQFRKAIAADGKAYQAHYALGVVEEHSSRKAEAADSYRRSVSIQSDFEPAISALTQMLIRDDRLSDAESFLNRQRSVAPGSAAVLASLAEVRSVQKNSAEAQSLAQQALKLDPDYRPAMVVLARDHYRNRRIDLALYTLTAILDGYGSENPPRDKNNADARLIRALILKEQGNRKAAIAELKTVVELRPDILEARLNLAAYYLEAGNAQDAVPVLEGALEYDASDVLVHLNLGDAYRLQGRPNEALKQLEWVVQAAPKLAQAHYNMGLVYLFSSKVEGVTPEQAVDRAIVSLETYSKMRPRTRSGPGDDAEELLKRARNKKSIIEAMKEQPAAGGDEFE